MQTTCNRMRTRKGNEMARAKFSAIEEDIVSLGRQIQKDSAKAEKVDRLAKLLGQQKLSEISLDMDDQDFDAVRAADASVTENIAMLIHGLDAITQSFSSDFEGMTQETVSEKFIGIFSSKKREAMKADRVRNASIDKSLDELIRKSDTIGTILNKQLNVLTERQARVLEGQQNVNAQYEETEKEREVLVGELDALQAENESLRAKAGETVGPELARLETQIAEIANKLNEARETLQTKTTLQQSLDAFRRQYANYAESLAKQIAAQKTMIEKLKLDTEQRSILYKTLTESIKAAQQQELAHQINETGQATDNMADTLMTQIGASAQNRVISMMESYKDYQAKLKEKEAQRGMADQKFAQRFSKVFEEVNSRYMESE